MIRAHAVPIPEPGEVAELAAEERRHVRSARRARDGHEIELIDGAGTLARARLEARGTLARVVERRQCERPPDLALAVAVARGTRFEMIVEKCAELGIAALEPIVCERSIAGRGAGRGERWRRVALAALKQSGQPWLPRIEAPAPLESVLRDSRPLIVLDSSGAPEPLPEAVQAAPLRILVGPEGGFSESERRRLADRGARMISLPGATLRIETAALVAAVLGLHALGKI